MSGIPSLDLLEERASRLDQITGEIHGRVEMSIAIQKKIKELRSGSLNKQFALSILSEFVNTEGLKIPKMEEQNDRNSCASPETH